MVRGAFERLRVEWPQQIRHNDRGIPEKKIRYQVGNERLAFLKEHAERFAYGLHGDDQIVAFLLELEEEDLDYRMLKQQDANISVGNYQKMEQYFYFLTFGLIRLETQKSMQ